MKELVSIVVPIYNIEDYIDSCVDSLVKQTYENLEIILVNDGSKDNSREVCESWASKDDRVIVINKQNGGLASARNAGLNAFTGDYITFVDGDDYIEKKAIETMVSEMREKNVDIVRCAMNRDINGNITELKDIDGTRTYSSEELMIDFYYYKEGMCGSVCDKLFKAKFFETLRFPDGLNSEDYYVLFEVYQKANGMYYDDNCFYNYRLREDSICATSEVNEHSFDKIKISDEVYKITEKNIPEYKEHAKAFQLISRFFIYTEVINKNYGEDSIEKWKKELKDGKKYVLNNSNIDKSIKIQYFCFIHFTKIYMKLYGMKH